MIREPYGGWQYKVYVHGDRVEKRPKSDLRVAFAIVRSDVTFVFRPRELVSEVAEITRRREKAVQELKRRPIDRSLLANVEFDGQVAFQDRVTPIWRAIDGAEIERINEMLDSCISCLLSCWKNGFVEDSYNFTENYGLSGERAVVMDFGELCFSKEEARSHIREERWIDAHSFDLLPLASRSYLRSEMARRVTEERLNELWNANAVEA